MSTADDKKQDDLRLRAAAERQIDNAPRAEHLASWAEELLHELQVHQVELEMQNEALRQVEIALTQSRDRYVDLYEFAPVGYLTLSSDGMIAETNLTCATLLGRERNKLLRRGFISLVIAEDQDRWTQHSRSVRQGDGQGKGSVELTLQRGDGTVFQALLNCERQKVGVGDAAVRIALTDITELKEAEAAQRGSDARYRAIVQSANDAVVTVNSAGNVVDWNRAAERLFGYTDAEMVGQPLAIIMPERFRQGHWDGLAWMAADGVAQVQGKSVELDGRRNDGSEFPFDLSVASWENPEGWFCTAIMRDLSERKRVEAERAKLEAQLRESQKMEALGVLAGGVAHDFNNALAVIIGNMEMARQDVGPGHVALQRLDEIGKASLRTKALVQQILAFGRRQTTERKVMSLTPVLEESVRLMGATLPAGVSINVKCAVDAPAVLVDASQIEQVVLNLCNNAWYAIRGQAQPGTIEIRLEACEWGQDGTSDSGSAYDPLGQLQPGRYACLSVRDNGSGMDAATREHLFEPFFTTKSVGEGTGLGLSVVHGIVRGHHGVIQVQSQPGEGTVFRIYFPEAASPASLIPAPGQELVPAPAATASALQAGDGVHVLYIDDDESIVDMMKQLLERKGYCVSGYTDQNDALAAARAEPGRFDLVVTDYNMPGMSGLEVARALREIRADLPIVLASGNITEELRAQAPAAGVSELVFKPCTVKELCEALDRSSAQAQRRKTKTG